MGAGTESATRRADPSEAAGLGNGGEHAGAEHEGANSGGEREGAEHGGASGSDDAEPEVAEHDGGEHEGAEGASSTAREGAEHEGASCGENEGAEHEGAINGGDGEKPEVAKHEGAGGSSNEEEHREVEPGRAGGEHEGAVREGRGDSGVPGEGASSTEHEEASGGEHEGAEQEKAVADDGGPGRRKPGAGVKAHEASLEESESRSRSGTPKEGERNQHDGTASNCARDATLAIVRADGRAAAARTGTSKAAWCRRRSSAQRACTATNSGASTGEQGSAGGDNG